MQQIVAQLVFNGDSYMQAAEMSPWLDLRVPAKEVKLSALAAQTHRRLIKTHLARLDGPGRPSVLNNLKYKMPAEMHRIARFLDIPIDESRWDAIVEYCSFDQMKKNATQSVTLGGAFWDGGAEVFIHKGVNERWKEVLSAAESAEYEAPTIQELGQEYAHWLATGQVYESMPIWFTVKLYGQLKKVGKNSKPFLHS